MATCIPFQSQLSSIMEVLVKAAVAEISKLVDDKCAFLHLEISRKQTENEMLKRKLLLMDNKRPQLKHGFENYRGTDVTSNCPQPASGIKFPEIEEAGFSFTIKEESPDETLWISDSTEPSGPTVRFPNPASSERHQFDEDHQLSHPEVSRQTDPEFRDSYTSSHRPLQVGGLHFTVKMEKDEDRSGFSQDGCQHGAGKHNQQTSDFSIDERETQLWSSIIEGSDIDGAFPDFSSVVEEYSNTFPDPSDAHVVSTAAKASGAQQAPCNGLYSSDAPQGASFPPRLQVAPQQERQKEQLYSQRNSSHVTHSRPAEDRNEREPPASERAHAAFSPSGCHPHAAHRPLSAAARGYGCMQCGKTFSRLHQFKLHQQSHKRKRAFWCTVCGKSFQCSSHLSIHHRTHTGEKPYGCGLCGKRFTQQSSLRVHQRTHSGERPYSCSQCGKTFILMHHLKRHRIIHTYS